MTKHIIAGARPAHSAPIDTDETLTMYANKPSYEELENRIRALEGSEIRLQQLEAQLQDEINWRRMLVQESRDGIVVIDGNCKVLEANQHFADMLGYSMAEIMQLHAWDWDTQFSREEIIKLAREVDGSGHHFLTRHRKKDGSMVDVELSNSGSVYNGKKMIFCICRDITEELQAKTRQEQTIARLQTALAEVKTLRGILPLCSFCKNIRDDEGYWEAVDVYLKKHSETDFSHSVCPDCMKKHYPEYAD